MVCTEEGGSCRHLCSKTVIAQFMSRPGDAQPIAFLTERTQTELRDHSREHPKNTQRALKRSIRDHSQCNVMMGQRITFLFSQYLHTHKMYTGCNSLGIRLAEDPLKVETKWFDHPNLKEQWLEVWSRYRGVRAGCWGGALCSNHCKTFSLNF